jgi:hypothetical protein
MSERTDLSSAQRNDALVQWIRRILTRGVPMTDDVRAFMQATFGGCDPAAIFTTAAPCERDSLLELLFFPDPALRLRYEIEWGDYAFCDADLEAVLDALTATALPAHLDAGAPDAPFVFELPAFVCGAFVRRLNITWQPPDPIRQMIDQGLNKVVDHGWTKTIMAQLRHSGVKWHTGQIEMMVSWVRKADRPTADASEELPWLLTLLPELPPDRSPHDFLIDKKAFYFESLCRAEAFAQRCREPMELLMVQGYRAGCGSIAQWRDNMARIDRLCMRLFGRTTFFQRPAEQWVEVPGDASV